MVCLTKSLGVGAVFFTIFFAAGCGRRDDAVSPPVVPVADVTPVSIAGETGGAVAAALANGTGTEVAAGPAADILTPVKDGDLTETLNTVLSDYVDAYDRVPRDLAEMVRLKLIPRVPPAPAGKRYVINQEKREIMLVEN